MVKCWTMNMLLSLLIIVSTVSCDLIRNVTEDKYLRSNFCNSCSKLTITSTGGALEHQPQRLTTLVQLKDNELKILPPSFQLSSSRIYMEWNDAFLEVIR